MEKLLILLIIIVITMILFILLIIILTFKTINLSINVSIFCFFQRDFILKNASFVLEKVLPLVKKKLKVGVRKKVAL